MSRARFTAIPALLLLSAAACETAAPPPEVPATPTPTAAPSAAPQAAAAPRVKEVTLDSVGLDPAALDTSADPCSDFYQFACGGWMSKAEIPADKPRWDRSFTSISDRNEAALRKILEQDAKAKDADPTLQKVGVYYDACMDEGAIEADKLKPIAPLIGVVKKVKDKKTLGDAILALHKHRIWALFDLADTQDAKDATRVIARIDQGGLGLPDRDYYVKDDEKSRDIRQKYTGHVERMMKLTGLSAKDAKRAAADVMRVETELAKVSKTRVERRDPKAVYNKIDRPGVETAAPSFSWSDYFKGLGFAGIKDINVTHVPFLEGMNKLIDTVSPAEFQAYLTWHIVRALAESLPRAFAEESFTMTAALTGQKEIRPRWKRCISETDAALGELLAQPFVKQYFSPESKAATLRYVHEITEAFAREVDKLPWMDGATRQKAIAKLGTMAYHIGYPNRWRTYDYEVKTKHFAENLLAARAFRLRYDLGKVGKPVDREEWQMTPPTVNAYYESSMNHMVFPAGILQPPFFNSAAAIPVNLGAMGMVVGHELTHGFDDRGSQFDDKGNLENWWTDQVSAEFKAKTACVEQQYAGYEALPGLKLNGKLTLGENIADNGGIKLAFAAYRSMRKGAEEVTVAGGYSEDQQFFLGVGQAWCTKQRDEFARLRVQTDSHSPAKYRVNGPLSNFPAFTDAFSCKAGAPMRRQNACDVW